MRKYKYKGEIEIYNATDDESSRFIIKTRGSKPLIFLGLNPSTANKEDSDATINKIEEYANINGFDSIVIINLYPFRSTNPNDLPKQKDASIYNKNLSEIENIINKVNAQVILIACGTNIKQREYLLSSFLEIHNYIKSKQIKWISIGLTKEGYPRHPSRGSYRKLEDFCIEGFLKIIDKESKSLRTRKTLINKGVIKQKSIKKFQSSEEKNPFFQCALGITMLATSFILITKLGNSFVLDNKIITGFILFIFIYFGNALIILTLNYYLKNYKMFSKMIAGFVNVPGSFLLYLLWPNLFWAINFYLISFFATVLCIQGILRYVFIEKIFQKKDKKLKDKSESIKERIMFVITIISFIITILSFIYTILN